MQTVTMDTPVERCVQLSRFAERMFRKTQNPALMAMADLLAQERAELEQAHAAYLLAVLLIIDARADIRWVNFKADRGVRAVMKDAEKADGKEGGTISKAIAPQGVTAIIKSRGQTQVNEMKKLEGTLSAAAPLWADAPAKQAEVQVLREEYQGVVDARKKAGEDAALKRYARNAAKGEFVLVYAKAAALVKVEYPKQKEFQDMLFDKVRADPDSDGDEEEVPASGPVG